MTDDRLSSRPQRRLVILAEGHFGFHHGKTAVGVIRYGPDQVIAVIDSTQAGGNVSSILPDHDIPIVATLEEALALEPRPDTLLIGIAPTGGRLPGDRRSSPRSGQASTSTPGCTPSSATTPSSRRRPRRPAPGSSTIVARRCGRRRQSG